MIDKNIPVPLYYQVKKILLEEIKAAPEGSPIPPEMELCRRFDISRPTVRQAVSELVQEGYLERHKGRGTFVSSPKISRDYHFALQSFNDEMEQKGLVPSTKVLEFTKTAAGPKTADKLSLSEGEAVIKLDRLRSVNGEPVLLVVTYLPYTLFPNIFEHDLEHSSLYRTMAEKFGRPVERTVRTLEARPAAEYEADLLKLKPGAPIQYIETVGYLIDKTPVEFSIGTYRGDRNTFTFELRRK